MVVLISGAATAGSEGEVADDVTTAAATKAGADWRKARRDDALVDV